MRFRALLSALVVVICLVATSVGWAGGSITPEGIIKDWVILGPFPNPETNTAGDRGAFDADYLQPLGGEPKTRITPDTKVTTDTARVSAKPVKLTGSTLDFCSQYTDTSNKLVYAYAEVQSSADQDALFFLGSDDGAKVWVNGAQAFEVFPPGGRAVSPRQDKFKVNLHKGANSILVKVANGTGGWALALEVYGEDQGRKIEAEIARETSAREIMNQELGLGRAWPGYVFWPGDGVPKIIWRDLDKVRQIAGDLPLTVRWFDSSLNEVKSPGKPGRYTAYIEAKLRDGTPLRRAMTFYCAPPELNLWSDWGLQVPYLGKPIDADAWKANSDAISSHAGRAYRESLVQTEAGAVLLAGLTDSKAAGGEPPEVLNDDFQLALKLKLSGLSSKVTRLRPPQMRGEAPTPALHEGTPDEAAVKPDAKVKIDEVCKQWAEDSGEPFTILVARHGVIVTHAAFGKTADGVAVDLNYRKDVMSITKAVTGVLFSRLLEQGLVKLDDPIGNVLPGFPTKGERALTYRHLFTHTSGLSGHGEWGGIHNPYLENVILDGLDSLHPGRAHNYNGMGYDLAAKAMETMTGKSIVRLMHEDLFAPLGIGKAPLNDCAYGAVLTSYELATIGQLMSNKGSYGDKFYISEDTFAKLLPTSLKQYYPDLDVDWGIGLTWFRETKPGSKDLILGEHVIGHGSASSCILRVDLDKDLVIVQIRRTAGPKYGQYLPKFLQAIADSLT